MEYVQPGVTPEIRKDETREPVVVTMPSPYGLAHPETFRRSIFHFQRSASLPAVTIETVKVAPSEVTLEIVGLIGATAAIAGELSPT